MIKRWYWILFALILAAAFIIRIVPVRSNNFYFTMDQADDALHVRELLSRGQWPLVGPVTNIDNLFAGPGWYYFIAVGYALAAGNPVGALIEVILINVLTFAMVMLRIRKEVSAAWALIIGSVLLTSWALLDTSRYAFNPFPLTIFAFLVLFSLSDVFAGKEIQYIWAAFWVGLGFHAEVAGSMAVAIFFIIVTVWARIKGHISWTMIAGGMSMIVILFTPFLVSEIQTDFLETRTVIEQFHTGGTFTRSSVSAITQTVHEDIVRSTFRQIPELGLALFCAVVFFVWYRWFKKVHVNKFIYRYSILSFTLLAVSWIFFSSNNGWREWHTLYLSPVVFVMLLLMLHEMDIRLSAGIIIVSLYSHLAGFIPAYIYNLTPTSDASLLHNELAAIDWVYRESSGRGFAVYNYLPSVYDYPYQYLFWWYGRKTYGYLPCEYASYPGAPKLVIPGAAYYTGPAKPCTDLRFLIIEPDDAHAAYRQSWIDGASAGSTLLTQTRVGTILVEKRHIDAGTN